MADIDQAAALAIIRELSGQDNIFTIPKLYVRFMGDLDGGLFLNQLIFWSDKGKRGDGFIYKSRVEWQEEIFLSDYALRKATKKLKDMGLLETKLLKAHGAPTLHYRLDLGALLEALVGFVKSENGFVEINKSDSLESTNGYVEIDETESLESTKPGFVETDDSITDEYHINTKHDVGDVSFAEEEEKEDARVLLLLDLAQDKRNPLDLKIARAIVEPYNVEQVSNLVTYARKASGLRDPVAFVISRLRSGELPVMSAADAGRDRYDDDTYQEIDGVPVRETEPVDPELAEALQLWQAALGELQLQMTRETFTTWLRPARVSAYENGSLTVAVENEYVKDWLDNRLRSTIERTLTSVAGEKLEVKFTVEAKQVTEGEET